MASTNDLSTLGVSGVTTETPSNIVIGAGVLYKDFEFDAETGKWAGTLLGATSGGTKVTITPEFLDIEVDGVNVKTVGMTQKVGETATIETNLAEVRADLVKSIIVGSESGDVITSNSKLSTGDYVENLAFVIYKTTGDPSWVLFPNALCTSGLELEATNKEAATVPCTFECYATLTDGGTNVLPYELHNF